MSNIRPLRSARGVFATALTTALLAIAPQAGAIVDLGLHGEGPAAAPSLDRRTVRVEPTAAQRAAAAALDAEVRFGPTGTPRVVIRYSDYLSGPSSAAPEAIARDFLKRHATLFGINAAQVDAMITKRVSPLYESPDYRRMMQGEQPLATEVPHVVRLVQSWDGIEAAYGEGVATVAIAADGRVVHVGSNLSRESVLSGSQQLGAAEAISAAAADVGFAVGALSAITVEGSDFEVFDATGALQPQRARLRTLAVPGQGVRYVWEVWLLHNDAAEAETVGFKSFVDAQDGTVWVRENRVLNFDGEGAVEAKVGLPNTEGTPLLSPAWQVFPNQPIPRRATPDDANPGDDNRERWCWNVANLDDPTDDSGGRSPEECQGPELRNIGARVPWDALSDGTPTLTTLGNNASAAVANVVFLAPDTFVERPVAAGRTYDFPYTDAWANSACDPQVFFDPLRNFGDADAATANLFAGHNRMHDFTYLLGWTEVNSNMQLDNFGNTPVQREKDPQIGQSQAGRLTYHGRNNANQVPQADGVPCLTNQYMWQPWSKVIYPTCADGSFDFAIIAHEYFHATSNRMTGGLSGIQSGAMGEAWSDLSGIEYMQAYGLAPIGKENPYALAVFATGDPEAGIRNYAIDQSPLNFGDMNYDPNGTGSPHSDSEIWGAINHDVRAALIAKYQAQYPFEDRWLQLRCVEGERSSEACPGNRRWFQMLMDGLLIQAPSPSMADARDAMLASDMMRYRGENQAEMWYAFAHRGLGKNALAFDSSFRDPRNGFVSPLHGYAQITFVAEAPDGSRPKAKWRAGQYEARVEPVADTDPETAAYPDTVRFVPGEYEFFVQADGYGLHRFKLSFEEGQVATAVFPLRTNVASVFQGGSASGDEDTSGLVRSLIDDTESTNWKSSTQAGNASEGKGEGQFVEGRQVTVKLAERATITEANVSALNSPGDNRFSALRSFDLLYCDAETANCGSDAGFQPLYSSPDDFFNGRYMRPKAPHLKMKSIDIEDVTATHVKFVVRDNQCTGGPDFQGDANPNADPQSSPDCDTGTLGPQNNSPLLGASTTAHLEVRAAELQLFTEPQGEVRIEVAETPQRLEPVAGTTKPAGVVTRGGALGGGLLLMLLCAAGLRRRG